jgi:SAM-dependent methyltransferase
MEKAMSRLVPRLLLPGWPDEARRVVQEPVFRAAAAEGHPRGRCLNAGAGEGLYCGFLESFAEITQIVNVDITLPQISRRRSDPRHTDVLGSVTELPLEDGSIDWILSTEVIEHVEDDRAAATELGRVLKPGGFALISVPTPPAPHDAGHVREGYSLQELRELVALGGLEIVWHRYCFHLLMRWLVGLWRWQYTGRGRRRNLMPRIVVLAFGHADRLLPIGSHWDLVILARKR